MYNIIADVLVAVILLFFISRGIKKGGVQSILELLSFIITIVAVMLFKDTVTDFIFKIEPVSEWLNSLSEYFVEKYSDVSPLADMIVPPHLMAEALVSFIINILGFIITYFVVKFLLKVVLKITDLITSLPIIRSANNLIGGVVGGIKGCIIIWLIMAVMLLFTATEFYVAYTSAVADSTLTKILYNSNLLFTIFK